MINVDIDAHQLAGLIDDLAATEKQAQKALNTTLTKMAAWIKTRSLKGLSAELKIQQKILRRRLKSTRLQKRGDGSQVTVWFGLDAISMIYLQAKETKAGVKASGGRFVKGAFIANGANGNQMVFKRRGAKRLPIEKQTVKIADQTEEYIEDNLITSAEFETRFFQIFEHELKWQTRTQ